jgi:hypothetical protein
LPALEIRYFSDAAANLHARARIDSGR